MSTFFINLQLNFKFLDNSIPFRVWGGISGLYDTNKVSTGVFNQFHTINGNL